MNHTDRECLIGLNLIPQLTPKRTQKLFGRFKSFGEIWNAPASAFAQMFGSRVIGEAIADQVLRHVSSAGTVYAVILVSAPAHDVPLWLRTVRPVSLAGGRVPSP